MTDPQTHSTRRRLFAQPFANSSILAYEAVVREKVETAIAKVGRDAAAGEADILKWFTFMATDVIGQLSFGRSFETLQHEEVSPSAMWISH
jgi:cytochrome P450